MHIGAENNEIRWTITQAEKLTAPPGEGWELERAQPLVLPTPNGQMGICCWALWSRDKQDEDHERD